MSLSVVVVVVHVSLASGGKGGVRSSACPHDGFSSELASVISEQPLTLMEVEVRRPVYTRQSQGGGGEKRGSIEKVKLVGRLGGI